MVSGMPKCRIGKHDFNKDKYCIYCHKTRKELNIIYTKELSEMLTKLNFKTKLSRLYKKELLKKIDRI